MIYSHAQVSAWAEKHKLSTRMASTMLSGAGGQSLIGHAGTTAALARRGFAEKFAESKYAWRLSAAGRDLLAELDA